MILVTAGKSGAGGQFFNWRLESFCDLGTGSLGRRELRSTFAAELDGLGILSLTFRALDGHC